MVVLQTSRVSKSYGIRTILDGASLTLHAGEKAGLVGPNGAGKTTLLKILSGHLTPDGGEIIRPGGVTLGCLAQDGGLSSQSTVMEEMLSVFTPLIEQEKTLRDLELSMGVTRDPAAFEEVSEQYSVLSEDFRNRGGYEFRANIKAVLNGLKFGEEYHGRVTGSLSGGQKTRLAMARLLLSGPDVLVLDEPTNHLDMETLSWMEKYLQAYSGSILVVSHDRYFLDSLVGTVYELERGRLKKFTGNYSKFISLRAGQKELEKKIYHKQREEIARTEDFIRRNIARASTTGRAQSRQKALEKMELADKPTEMKSARFSFSTERSSGREVLAARDLSIGYRDNTLCERIDLLIERGERVALIGPNGAGKSTLLKTAAGILKPREGHLTLGFNVSTGYYDQDQTLLEGSITVLEELWNRFPHMDEKDVRGVLGSFLFSGEDVLKTVNQLSGGEKARLVLAGLMLRKANFLLLDEPTNHLDVYSREVLEEALSHYEGTVLFVSHDRYFLNKLATRVIEISPSGVRGFSGDYDSFLAKKGLFEDTPDRSSSQPTGKDKARLSYRQEKEARRLEEKRLRQISDLERSIEETESLITSLEAETYSPEIYQNLDLLLEKNTHLERLRTRLDSYYTQWDSVISGEFPADQWASKK
ncbi:MAG: multidrug ABC transporter ATP-binding protein [Peptococcaceae bacterium BRH_c4a]|nr:MAG: multidrug ABC transporter ATP-binding protein [Peptococcaceae bacterium BRH_c4a]